MKLRLAMIARIKELSETAKEEAVQDIPRDLFVLTDEELLELFERLVSAS